MRRSVALQIGIVVAFLILILSVSQLVIPPLLARHVEHDLTKEGGTAHVSLRAFPALKLLFQHGDKIEVTGDGLRVQLGTGKRHVLNKLDNFGSVHIHLTNVTSGPFDTRVFTLDRSGGAKTYQLGVSASFTPAALASYLGSSVGGGLGGLFGGIAGGVVGGTQPVPVEMHAQLESDSGNPRVVNGAGTLAGVPMGPVLEAVAAAVIAQL